MAEHLIRNEAVGGSTPPISSTKKMDGSSIHFFRGIHEEGGEPPTAEWLRSKGVRIRVYDEVRHPENRSQGSKTAQRRRRRP